MRLSGEISAPRHQEFDFKAGADFRVGGGVSLRAGYNSRNDLGNGLSLGAGFRISSLDIDYAYVGFRRTGEAHRVGLTYRWGGPGSEEPLGGGR